MGTLSAKELLEVWERGQSLLPVEQALALLAGAYPGLAPGYLAELPIGQRDGLLLTLREEIFGSRLTGLATCPGCAQRLDLSFEVAEIRAEPPGGLETPLHLSMDGLEVSFRVPDSRDLIAIAGSRETGTGRNCLLERCVLEARSRGRVISIDELSPAVLEAIGQRMAEADPQADVQLSLICPGCGHGWPAAFDIVSFIWSEICVWAQRTLSEVHILASTYGWSETSILAMSPQRRQIYLGLIGGD